GDVGASGVPRLERRTPTAGTSPCWKSGCPKYFIERGVYPRRENPARSLREVRLVDLLGVRHDEEALARGGEAEAVGQTDEAAAPGALAAPEEGGRELEGVGGAQGVNGEEPFGAGADLLDRLDLEGARPQVGQKVLGLAQAGVGELALPFDARQGAHTLDGGRPPEDDLRVAPQEVPDPAAGGLLDQERDQRRAVPEPQRSFHRSSRRARRTRPSASTGRGRRQNSSPILCSGARRTPERTSSSVAASGAA